MTTAAIRFAPAILARLGEELNQGSDQSILELIKNSYDANATTCVVEFFDVTRPGGRISIVDDGDGMDVAGIRDGWLVLGKSSKKAEVQTRLGRSPAGSKGLGRLAALRLGNKINLTSTQKGTARRKHTIEIDWEEFEKAPVVEDVMLEIFSEKNARGGHGTKIDLIDLRNPIRPEEVKRLARSVLLLTDPFEDKENGFSVSLKAPEYADASGLLDKKYFDFCDYHLIANIDAKGKASARILDWKGQVLAQASIDELRPKIEGQYHGLRSVVFELWVFLLDGSNFSSRAVTKGEVSQWLKHFGGVHVYQDNIRVAPYGNAGNDWLEMNLARARSPEERPSTNTSIGRVAVSTVPGMPLKQKTDRTGFIENDIYDELRHFAKDALDWLARWRLQRAEERRAAERAQVTSEITTNTDNIERLIAESNTPSKGQLALAFKKYDRTRQKEVDTLKKEIQLYRTLSTAGINAATFSHESHGSPIKSIELAVNSLETRVARALAKNPLLPRILEQISSIKSACSTLATLSTATLSLVQSSKRRVERVEVNEVMLETATLMERFIHGRDTELKLALCREKPFLRTSRAAIESIITNLVNNSLRAFERDGIANRSILIETICNNRSLRLIVADSGPGITGVSIKDIWSPGITTNEDGTGLGLTIVRDTLRDIGGKAEVVANGRLGGAEFLITIPILGA